MQSGREVKKKEIVCLCRALKWLRKFQDRLNSPPKRFLRSICQILICFIVLITWFKVEGKIFGDIPFRLFGQGQDALTYKSEVLVSDYGPTKLSLPMLIKSILVCNKTEYINTKVIIIDNLADLIFRKSISDPTTVEGGRGVQNSGSVWWSGDSGKLVIVWQWVRQYFKQSRISYIISRSLPVVQYWISNMYRNCLYWNCWVETKIIGINRQICPQLSFGVPLVGQPQQPSGKKKSNGKCSYNSGTDSRYNSVVSSNPHDDFVPIIGTIIIVFLFIGPAVALLLSVFLENFWIGFIIIIIWFSLILFLLTTGLWL